MKRLKLILSAALLAAGLTTAAVLPASTAYAASCPDNNAQPRDPAYDHYLVLSDYVNLRSGPSTGCSVVFYPVMRYMYIGYDCYKTGDGGTWTHVQCACEGEAFYGGWIRDDLLYGHGSNYHC
jgi:hypothetical protein